MKNNKVIITGSTGFVGKNLTSYLENESFNIIPLNLRGEWRLESHTESISLVHLAGKAHDIKNVADKADYFRINTELTIDLFDRFLQTDIRDFIYFSSVKAVADDVKGPLLETVIPDPITPYGQSKQQAEQYLRSKSLPGDKRLFILRPCMIHGPGNKGNLNLLYNTVKRGIPYPLAAFQNKRSFLSIENLNCIVKSIIADNSLPGGVYNLADDQPLSTNEVVEIIAEASMSKAKIWALSPILIRSMARIGDTLRLPLNTETLKKLTESYVVDNTKIKKALGISNLPVSSREGLLKTIRSFQSK